MDGALDIAVQAVLCNMYVAALISQWRYILDILCRSVPICMATTWTHIGFEVRANKPGTPDWTFSKSVLCISCIHVGKSLQNTFGKGRSTQKKLWKWLDDASVYQIESGCDQSATYWFEGRRLMCVTTLWWATMRCSVQLNCCQSQLSKASLNSFSTKESLQRRSLFLF